MYKDISWCGGTQVNESFDTIIKSLDEMLKLKEMQTKAEDLEEEGQRSDSTAD